MTPAQLRKLDRELTEFLDYITDEMGRPERRRAMSLYLTGLLLEGERKTAKSMGRRLAEHDGEVEGMRQRLQQCVSVSDWADEEVRRRLAWRFEQRLKPEAFIVDDTGFPKKGRLSVGVKRQYSGTLGRTDNCQVAPSLHVATDGASGCIGMRLYLPEEWANDQARRESRPVCPMMWSSNPKDRLLWICSMRRSVGDCRHDWSSLTRAMVTVPSFAMDLTSAVALTWWGSAAIIAVGRLAASHGSRTNGVDPDVPARGTVPVRNSRSRSPTWPHS
jgi:hypothetical protein